MAAPGTAAWAAIAYNAVLIFGFAHAAWFYLARGLPPVASTLSVMLIPVLGKPKPKDPEEFIVEQFWHPRTHYMIVVRAKRKDMSEARKEIEAMDLATLKARAG